MSETQRRVSKKELTYDDYVATQKAAEEGNPDAICQIGFFYKFGLFVEKDEDEALKCFIQAGHLLNADAQWAAGDIYRYGTEKMPPNPMLAAKWLRYATHTEPNGRNLRCYGECIENGIGVMVDKAEAADFYSRAVEAGDRYAFYRLGRLYLLGDGVSQDVPKGLGYIYTAKMRGVEEASNYWAWLEAQGLLKGIQITEKEVD